MSPNDSLISLIERAGLATYGINMFKGPKARIPAGAGPFVSINPTGGAGVEGVHDQLIRPYLKPSWQIVVTAQSFDDADQKASLIWSVILNTRNTYVDTTWWRETVMKQVPFPLGLDDVGRPRIAFNFDATVRLP